MPILFDERFVAGMAGSREVSPNLERCGHVAAQLKPFLRRSGWSKTLHGIWVQGETKSPEDLDYYTSPFRVNLRKARYIVQTYADGYPIAVFCPAAAMWFTNFAQQRRPEGLKVSPIWGDIFKHDGTIKAFVQKHVAVIQGGLRNEPSEEVGLENLIAIRDDGPEAWFLKQEGQQEQQMQQAA